MTNNIIYYELEKEKRKILKYKKSDFCFNVNESLILNLKHNLRPYQKESIENFILLNNPDNSEIISDILEEFKSSNSHHLFHMATGSGKTLVMAFVILYLNSIGYKKFIFTTNQTNLLSKTRLNLLPSLNSNKCEYRNTDIEIDGNKKQIREVDNFSKYSNDIEIIFSTIHNLHNKISNSSENSINAKDLQKENIVILADEAHHFQTKTTNSTSITKSWEETINKILGSNKKNKLVEFTATMNLFNKEVFKKYRDKIIYDYDLKSFRKDGYSKEISLIQNNNKEDKILEAILINQYRYEIGLNNNINVTPKILFKSQGKIKDLEKEKKEVLNVISNLNLLKLDEVLNNSNLSYFLKLKSYLNNKTKKEDFISLIKKQFNDTSSLIIHSDDKEKNKKMEIANNLDNNGNIRMIFAINMLNEGWDVLSLFDIVKLDSPTYKKEKGKTTTSEVQLIGRGARIFPYTYKDSLGKEKDKFKRKFDKNISHDLRLLEDMNFYSANENDYINKIKTELVDIGLKDNNESLDKVIKVKPKNELSEFAKTILKKFVYSNSLQSKYNENSLISDHDINIQITKDYSIKEENIINKINNHDLEETTNNLNITDFVINNSNLFIINNSINNFSYFNINNVYEKYSIKSKKELIDDIIKLGNKISITLKNKKINELKFEEKINILNDILLELSKQLERKRKIKIGSKHFKNKFRISETFVEYSKKEENTSNFNDKLAYKNTSGNMDKKDFKIENETLFYYDHISWDSGLELELYNLFDKNLDPENFLVIRNEVGFKMYNPFTEEGENYKTSDKEFIELNGSGFEPDFIVLRKEKTENKIYQYFIEVKGEDKKDNNTNKWKEALLEEINNENIIIEDNTDYRIYGVPFFTEENLKNDSLKKQYIEKITKK